MNTFEKIMCQSYPGLFLKLAGATDSRLVGNKTPEETLWKYKILTITTFYLQMYSKQKIALGSKI